MFEPTLVGSFSRMVNFLRISWSILSPSVVNFYAHLVNSRCRLHKTPGIRFWSNTGGSLQFRLLKSSLFFLKSWMNEQKIFRIFLFIH
ncbi:hypothetical protein FGL77_10630 [Loigolactobacillus coryniformis]|uniref:Uncharacterized protein n=1 Tax=Loigolactobacillus coryniformis TaxID=1610 RepID=A0A5B8TMV9_9LACO|nr:hypothetical protein FGL77_10630 [Loigolactobacillus coryniformis]